MILKAHDSTAFHFLHIVGLSHGEHVLEDGGDSRKEAFINAERHSVVCDEDDVPVIEPVVVILFRNGALRSRRSFVIHIS